MHTLVSNGSSFTVDRRSLLRSGRSVSQPLIPVSYAVAIPAQSILPVLPASCAQRPQEHQSGRCMGHRGADPGILPFPSSLMPSSLRLIRLEPGFGPAGPKLRNRTYFKTYHERRLYSEGFSLKFRCELRVANCNHNRFGLQSSRFLDRINCDYRGVKTELTANETTLIATRLQSSGSNHINCE